MSLTSKPAAEVASERKAALEQHAQILADLAEFGLSTSDPVGAIAGLIRERELVEATARSYAYRLADPRPGLALARAHETLAELGFADQGIPEVLRLLISQRDEARDNEAITMAQAQQFADERNEARRERDAYKASADKATTRCDKALRAELARAIEGIGPVIDYPETTTWCGRDAARVTRGAESWSFVRALRDGVALALYSRERPDGVTELWDGMGSRAPRESCDQPTTVPREVAIAALDALGWPVHPPVDVAPPVVASGYGDEAES